MSFLVTNGYLNDRTQKGFLPNVAGCIEHSATLAEAIRNARRHKKNIVVNWLDLANAFGSVRHSLIFFALNWYHVPTPCINLVTLYYNSLYASVATKNWTTKPFAFQIGVFQGCTISPLLFDVVYQICLDYVALFGTNPYVFSTNFDLKSKYGLIEILQLAYADDHTTTNSTRIGAQTVLNTIYKWLVWTDCMEAKPSKCFCLALLNPPSDSPRTYGQVDPELLIGPHRIKDISLNSFKFLGRFVSFNMKDKAQRDSICNIFNEHMTLVDSQFLFGASKAWIYNNYVMAYLAWPFIVYDFPVSFGYKLTKIVNRYLKKWLKVNKPASPEIFYLPEAGLNLKNPKTFLKSLQISKSHILANSKDPTVRYIAEAKLHKAIGARDKRWRPEPSLLDIESTLVWESKFMQNRSTLNSSKPPTNFLKTPTKEKRTLITDRAKKLEAENMRIRLFNLCMNGELTTWDNIMASDLSWNDLIYDISEDVLSFRLNAMSHALPCPNNLRRWGFKSQGKCPLCSKKCATSAHILSNCYIALMQGRYTWRHDNVLKGIHKDLVGLVQRTNRTNASQGRRPEPYFIKQGTTPRSSKRNMSSILHTKRPTDWQITFDFNNNRTIPPETNVITNQRPDIVIWSVSTKRIIWAEETVPLERNIVAAALRKTSRYANLKTSLLLKGWSVEDFTYEIGALGFIAKSFDHLLRKLGFKSAQRKFIRKRAGKLSLCSSYYIWTNRHNTNFIRPKLVTEPKAHTFPIPSPNKKRTPFCPPPTPLPKIKLSSPPRQAKNGHHFVQMSRNHHPHPFSRHFPN